MSLITHVLLVAFTLGTANQFSPTVLGLQLFVCMTIWTLETLVFKFMFYLEAASPRFFELMAFIGYKFVGLAISDLVKIFTSNTLANCVLGYFCLMIAVFMVCLGVVLFSTRRCPGTCHRRRSTLLAMKTRRSCLLQQPSVHCWRFQ
eukprot:TRINITY_DN12306_c0_g1_i2.p2 TRINITY_DN12306_c0_g1~~TRINITY_DN12306_c0_g1_i2.p2  ORF type:complete len:147 (+),score=13.59 TRINITY_DN12306_c0_g1_i2:601-1041(+)